MKRYLFDELDKTIAILGLIFSLALTIWLTLAIGRPVYTTVGVLSLLACAAYLIIRKSISPSTLTSLALAEVSSKVYLALNVIFFLLFAYSVLCFHLRPNIYSRPISYFIATALMASVAAVEFLFLPSRKWRIHFALFKIVLIGLSLEFSQLLIFPSVEGVDPWWHQMFTLNILNTGNIPQGFGYSQLPLMHLMTGSTSLITGLDYKMATMLSVSLPQVLCNVLLTFLLGNFLFNKRVGLIGGLLLGVANWHVNMGYWAIPNTIAAVFVPIILYLLLKVRRKKSYIGISLALLFMGALILTHTVTAVWMAVLLFVFWAGSKVYNRIFREWKKPVTLGIFILFSIGMLSWWAYASGHIITLAESIRWGFSIDYFLGHIPEEIILQAHNVPFSEQLFNHIGIFLFYSISLIGGIHMISKRSGNSYRFVMAFSGAITLALGFFARITSRSIITERWWYFSQILLALPLALALLLFCWTIKSKLNKALLLAALTFSLSFLMILSPVANMDNPTFSPNTQVRYAFSESELQAIETVSNMVSNTIGLDRYYSNLQRASYLVVAIDEQIYNRTYINSQDIAILIRTEIVNHPFPLFAGSYKLDYDPREVLTSQGFSKVYDCRSVSGFVYTAKNISSN